MTPEQKAERVQAVAGELVFVRCRAFVEFDAGQGVERWEDTPRGPHPVPLGESATSALLEIVEDDPGLLLGDLGMSGKRVARFAWHAAPRRIEIDPQLTEQLVLD